MNQYSQSTKVRAFFRHYPVISWVLVLCTVGFFVDLLLKSAHSIPLFHIFGLRRIDLLTNGALYQPISYMFLHGSFMHLFFNMFVLFMFGRELEELLGSKRFFFFFLMSGIAGGLVHVLFSPVYVVGASAGVYGLLLAYAINWPNRQLLVFFLFPLKVKYYIMILAGMEFMLSLQSLSQVGSGRVAHWAHIGGIAGGGLMLFLYRKKNLFAGLGEFNRKRRLRKHKALIDTRIREKEKVDLLLDKISQSGMESLSSSEKKFLNKASKKYYQDFPPE